jgi:hypothetical protein
MNLSKIIQAIKLKKELSSLDDSYLEEKITNYLKFKPKLKKYIEESEYLEKSKNIKLIVKEIRASLRETYGVFQIDNKERINLLKQLAKDPNSLDLQKEILKTHTSTKERLDTYEELYKKIFNITGEPKSILDLGSGLNPISIPFMNLKDLEYTAVELTKEDTTFLNEYFKIKNLKGKAIQIDLTKHSILPKADVAFLFKILETLETKGHKLAEDIIVNLRANYIVVSFSLRTITNKPMNYPIRGWFLRMLNRLNLEYTPIKEKDEIYYIIKKSN